MTSSFNEWRIIVGSKLANKCANRLVTYYAPSQRAGRDLSPGQGLSRLTQQPSPPSGFTCSALLSRRRAWSCSPSTSDLRRCPRRHGHILRCRSHRPPICGSASRSLSKTRAIVGDTWLAFQIRRNTIRCATLPPSKPSTLLRSRSWPSQPPVDLNEELIISYDCPEMN